MRDQSTRNNRQKRIFPHLCFHNVLFLVVLIRGHCASATTITQSFLRHGSGSHSAQINTTVATGPQPLTPERSLFVGETRVVGGSVVEDLTKHPFFAEWHGQYCGGALIHDDLVLTAAHCASSSISRTIYFRNIQRKAGGSVARTILENVLHPNYDGSNNMRDYDFQLLKLDSSPLVDETGAETGVKVIPPNTNPEVPATGDALWGIGYGQTDEDNPGMSDQLRDATIFAFSNEVCESQYQIYFEADYMFCSGVDGGGVDTCQGDSGGPIVHQDTNTLVGVVSFGIGCARPDYGGVNSRVSAAADWIARAKCELSNYPVCDDDGAAEAEATSLTTTPAETAAPGEGLGSLSITFVFDEYPEEIAWTFQAQGQPALFFQPFLSGNVGGSALTQTFDGLEENVVYSFKVMDREGDGMCCLFGEGQISIRDNVQGTEIWANPGSFGKYYQVDLGFSAEGQAQIVGESDLYQPSTWTDYETMVGPPQQEAWPGAMPTQATANTVVVNFQTDDYPDESSWELYHLGSPATIDSAVARQGENSTESSGDQWISISTWSGSGTSARTLVSQEITGLQLGWHRFVVKDGEGDGNCCTYGEGFVSLTGPLAAKDGEMGLVWGNDGKFWAMDEIYFQVDSAGFISTISFLGV